MNANVQRFLDGEIPSHVLSADEAAEARAWREWLDGLELNRETAPPWLETRIMANLPEDAPAPGWLRGLRWLLRPREIRIRPATAGLAAAAVVAAFLVMPGGEPPVDDAIPNAGATNAATNVEAPRVYVRFQVEAPEAVSVSIAGDFNGWSTTRHVLRDADADGIWSTMVPVTPGVHRYMFVVNGQRWMTDPRAQRYADDGFGMKNALIAVAPPPAWRSS